ncbi:NADP-dependent oxidoreductase domain-containing protein [Aspergillus minisclerotigenes]|uniref:NADP-dependent oxidoreductase domain-containing protein n=1 Tax=Aspergillus minisclerotigenes TaxID=656917 RepID=A0A5N6J8Y0_9EURO|nr:NADP-dependent oxidoreductase domain-containing protein [Aspergillus minisclerotigenes]
MEYTRVGDSGPYVSKVILGTASYGSSRWQEWILEEEAALPLLEHAFDVGINTWDTADAYSNGRSEETVGKALKMHSIPREQVVILTKILYALDPEGQCPISSLKDKTKRHLVNRVGLSRKHIFAAVTESTQRLGTYIGVLQIHRIDRECNLTETMKALHDVVESGLYIAEKNGWHKFIFMQNYHSLLYREEEREMIPFCRDSGVGILPWSPLARGVLAHPWTERDTKREKTDKLLTSLVRGRVTTSDGIIVSRVQEIAKKRGVKMSTIALAWSLWQGMCPITGLGSTTRIDEAVQTVVFELSDDEAAYLEEPYTPKEVAY